MDLLCAESLQQVGVPRGPAEQQAFRQSVGDVGSRRGDRHAALHGGAAVEAVIVAAVLGRAFRRGGITGCERAVAQFEQHADALGGAANDGVLPFAKDRQVTARIHQAVAATRSAQSLDRAIDGVALGDSTQIDAQPGAGNEPPISEDLKVAHPAGRDIETRIKRPLRGLVQAPAKLEHVERPWVDRQGTAGRAVGECMSRSTVANAAKAAATPRIAAPGRLACASMATKVPNAMRSLDSTYEGDGMMGSVVVITEQLNDNDFHYY